MKSKNDSTIFLPLNTNICGQIRPDKYLMKEQASQVFRKVESGNIITINTLKQEIEQDQDLCKLDDTS